MFQKQREHEVSQDAPQPPSTPQGDGWSGDRMCSPLSSTKLHQTQSTKTLKRLPGPKSDSAHSGLHLALGWQLIEIHSGDPKLSKAKLEGDTKMIYKCFVH
eukprot:GFUD01010037.1.p1 GENE.GFUD01010037.1~~GFUD01010037.1.p1  ORF type:complete len:101 (-),score=22.96 GFUD01010037.1:328-630(-)